MKCPRCSFRLTRGKFDSVNVRYCGRCMGNLIQPDRLIRLSATVSMTTSELMDRWRQYEPIETDARVRCPECRSMMMRRDQRSGIRLINDECEKCELLWLDPGEIELFLLGYKVSDKGKEAEQFRQIHENMSDYEKELLQKRIAKLKDHVPQKPDWYENPDNLVHTFFF